MAYSSDAAEQVVKFAVKGAQAVAVVAGRSAVRAAALIRDALRDRRVTAGKTKLSRMVKEGRPLKVFAVLDEDLKEFCRQARTYGVPFCVLKDRTANDGTTDILVRADDAGKVNRIYERFSLAVVDTEAVISNMNRARGENDLIYKLTRDDPGNRGGREENPGEARTAISRQSEPFLTDSGSPETGFPDTAERPSVKAALESIKRERKNKAERAAEVPAASELARRVKNRNRER